ncbi:MAG: type VI secretion system TssO, partial [Bacteroidales bacterium]
MKSKNHKEVTNAYLKFSGYLIASVLLGVLIFFCYVQTNKVEVNRIVEKTQEYDKIYVQQLELVSKVDTLFSYTIGFNTNLNDVELLNAVSSRKQQISSYMDGMSSKDVRLYQKLITEYNGFLGVKDSIRQATIDVEMIKRDLDKCVQDNSQASRKLTI